MLEIISSKEYTYGEIMSIEKIFKLNDVYGKYFYEENWYNPLEYQFMEMTWDNITIINNYGYWIKGSIPSDEELKELEVFETGLKEVIENGNYTKF